MEGLWLGVFRGNSSDPASATSGARTKLLVMKWFVLVFIAGRRYLQQNGPGVASRPTLSSRLPHEISITFCSRTGKGGTRAPVSAGVRRTLVCLSSLSGCAACVFFAVCSANTARRRRLTSISTTNCKLSFSFGDGVRSSSSQLSGTVSTLTSQISGDAVALFCRAGFYPKQHVSRRGMSLT